MNLAPWIKTLLGLDMKPNDHIYYQDKNGDTFPGVVLDVKKKIKILINYDESGNKICWVSPSNVQIQEIVCENCDKETPSNLWTTSFSATEHGKAEKMSCPNCGHWKELN